MAKPIKNLRDGLTAKRQERIRKRTDELLTEMYLAEVRKALELTQEQVAAQLGVNQAAVSKLENAKDMYVSTLRRFLSAMGAELRIVASFPDQDIVLPDLGIGPEIPVEGNKARVPSSKKRAAHT